MPGLFDFFGGGGGSGLFGNLNNYVDNNQDALIALGLGMAGGATPMEGFKGGMQGFLSGRKSDQSRVAGEGFLKELGLGVAPSAGPFSKPAPAMPGAAPAGAPAPSPVARPLYDGLIARGMQPHQAAAVVGNMQQESGFNPAALNQAEGANGLIQWRGDRFANLQRFAHARGTNPTDVNTQLDFIMHEMRGSEKRAGDAFLASTDLPSANNALRGYIRYGDNSQPQRLSYAQQFMPNQPAGGAPVQVAQAGGGPVPMPQQQPAAQPSAVPTRTVSPDQLGAIRNLPIETVMRWAMNPNLPENMAGVAKEIFKARLEDTKMTDGQKDYLRAKVDGYQGSFADWKNQPSFGETGRRDQFDRPIQGWRNPNTQRVTDANGQPIGPAGPVTAPIEMQTGIRKEIQGLPSYKNLSEAAPVYKNMLKSAGTDSKASDLNLVYGLAKIFDPGSVVREGEQVLVKSTASLPDWVIGSINSLNGGAALTPETRKALLAEAHNRMSSYKEMYDQDVGMYRQIAKDNRMNERHVIPDFGEFPEYVTQRTTAPPGDVKPNPPPRKAAAPAAAPTQADVAAEMRRRGLLK